MKILVTGNLGYIGVELTKKLLKDKKNEIIGYDTGYFRDCLFKKAKSKKIKQISYDVRKFSLATLKGVDTIVHLAAISNDPIGNKFKKATNQINLIASKKIIDLAIKSGVKKFIFASSCSIYGKNKKGICDEKSKIKPLTTYAKTKVELEKYLLKKKNQIKFTSLRFATACGSSDMFRLDLVLNDFVTSGFTKKKIELLSDGEAWRPLIDVSDMCKAIKWAIFENKKQSLLINVGSNKNNFLIKNLANIVAIKTKSELFINRKNKSDKRSYKVNFDMYKKLAPKYYPQKKIEITIDEILRLLKLKNYKNKNFRSSKYMRLKHLENLIENKTLNKDLDWH